jgi:hypothetical protein
MRLTSVPTARPNDFACFRFSLAPLFFALFARFLFMLSELGDERVGKCGERIAVLEKR